MARSLLRVGRVTLTEGNERNSTDSITGSGRTIEISGVEDSAVFAGAAGRKLSHDILGLNNLIVPVIWQERIGLNGYYYIEEASDSYTQWKNNAGAIHEWKLTLVRFGADTEVDLESRLSGALTRSNDFAAAGERWHAPAGGAYSYATSSTQPTVVTRAGAEGNIAVYRGIPINVYPRWSSTVANYGLGRCRFLDEQGLERTGTDFDTVATSWEANNSLTRVRLGAPGVLEVSCWEPGFWAAKTYDIQIGGASLGALPVSINLLRNDYECVVLRLTYSIAPAGRTQVDITLRRGSRFVELFVNTSFSTTIKIVRGSAEASTAGASNSYVRATSNDGNSNRYVISTLRTAATDLANGGLTKSAAVYMDAMIGYEFNGSGANVGDTATNLYAQYIGVVSERVIGFRR